MKCSAMKKHLLALVIALGLWVSIIPGQAFAAQPAWQDVDSKYDIYQRITVPAEGDVVVLYNPGNGKLLSSQVSGICQLGRELSEISSDDLTYVQRVYEYVVENIVYDHELAANIPVDYLPDVDRTIETGKGICLDYAALMTALLRSQGIPTKLVVGWSGTQYHAWISVYLEETGWVDGAIFFDGLNWSRLDPTLAAGNRGTSVKDYVNNNSNYKERFFY